MFHDARPSADNSLVAVTVAERGMPSRTLISPNESPGPYVATSLPPTVADAVPSMITNSLPNRPPSSSTITASPSENWYGFISAAICSAHLPVSPANSGIASTLATSSRSTVICSSSRSA